MPDRPTTNRGAAFETLFEAHAPDMPARGGALPPDLRRYGPTLAIPLPHERPTIIVNFVESLDGVVTFDPHEGSGAEVSGFNEPDRFVMGLLRGLSDAIVVGAGTVRAARNHVWTPGHVDKPFAPAYAAWRAELGLAPQPTTIVVSAAGNIPPDHPGLRVPDGRAIVLTTPSGATRLRGTLPAAVDVVETATDGPVPAEAIVAAATSAGARLLLCEGGPHLNATLVAAGLVDELFLTVAPQLVGRSGSGDDHRYSLLEGLTLSMDDARWGRLRSVRRSVDHLFLRYRFDAEG
jgi:riboflavin biosynthesis pyrimidine reductase